MTKKKLSIPEQIQDMQDKGITFHITNEKDACIVSVFVYIIFKNRIVLKL